MKKPPPVAIMSDLIVFPALSFKETVSLTFMCIFSARSLAFGFIYRNNSTQYGTL